MLTLSTIAFTLMFAVWLMFGVLGIPIRKELGLTDVQLAWLSAVAILNGSLWRLPAGIMTDRIGGRIVFIGMLAVTAVPTYLVSRAGSYGALLGFAFLAGFAGNSFSVGIAWNAAWTPRERQGFALDVFGAGNVGASVTKFIGPALIAVVPAAGYWGGLVPGGWRFVPFLYAWLLLAMALAVWLLAPRVDRKPGQGRALSEMLQPLRDLRVWRFSLYYVAVFGAYVALAAWLPKYYIDVFGLKLYQAALLTAVFIFPASLMRPVGGRLSDLFGARRVMYATFGTMLLTTLLLSMPYGHIVLQVPEKYEADGLRRVLPRAECSPVHDPCLPPRRCHGRRQGGRLQTHPRVLSRRRRSSRGLGGDARRTGRIHPPPAVRLHPVLDLAATVHLLHPLPDRPRLRALDAPDDPRDAAHALARAEERDRTARCQRHLTLRQKPENPCQVPRQHLSHPARPRVAAPTG